MIRNIPQIQSKFPLKTSWNTLSLPLVRLVTWGIDCLNRKCAPTLRRYGANQWTEDYHNTVPGRDSYPWDSNRQSKRTSTSSNSVLVLHQTQFYTFPTRWDSCWRQWMFNNGFLLHSVNWSIRWYGNRFPCAVLGLDTDQKWFCESVRGLFLEWGTYSWENRWPGRMSVIAAEENWGFVTEKELNRWRRIGSSGYQDIWWEFHSLVSPPSVKDCLKRDLLEKNCCLFCEFSWQTVNEYLCFMGGAA